MTFYDRIKKLTISREVIYVAKELLVCNSARFKTPMDVRLVCTNYYSVMPEGEKNSGCQ